jgi:GH24 family phage-related lysozyme (muramidase)
MYERSDLHLPVGWGHNCDSNKGTCNGITTPIDVCKADNLFWNDLKVPVHWIGNMPNSNLLSQNQLNALLSLVYNYGGNDVVSSGSIYKDMAAGRLDKICADILSACKNSKGEVQNSARRQAESALCAQPPTTPMKCTF